MIKRDFIVEKRNILNELRCNNLTLQELRFFTVYLAKIDSRRPEETRKVIFSLSDFLAIMEIGKINIDKLRRTTNSLLGKVVNIPSETGGYTGFQLFKRCRVEKDAIYGWCIEIDAHDDALPLMFEFKEQYFTYALWNALRLNSVNQLRMYEILKQYEWKRNRVISVDGLKKLLFMGEKEYSRFDNFKTKVLDSCKKALKENTDICYDYELIRKGRGGKVTEIKFKITKNTSYNDQLSLDEFIEQQKISDAMAMGYDEITDGVEDDGDYFASEVYPFLAEACMKEFVLEEIRVLYDMIVKIIPYRPCKGGREAYQLEVYDYLNRKYNELNWRAGKTRIKSRFGYLKKIIEADLTVLTDLG